MRWREFATDRRKWRDIVRTAGCSANGRRRKKGKFGSRVVSAVF